MRTITEAKSQDAIRGLSAAEIEAVSGGIFSTPVIGMPDRSQGCGTMWLFEQLLKRFFPRH